MSCAVSLPPDVEHITVDGEAFALRKMRDRDRGYVASTWGRSYRDRAHVRGDVFDREHPRVIDRCLERSETIVVCSPKRDTTLFGFAIGETGVLHYVYLAFDLRTFGLARTLIARVTWRGPSEPCEATHRFLPRAAACRHVFNPFRLGLTV